MGGGEPHLKGVYSIAPEWVWHKYTPQVGRREEQDCLRTESTVDRGAVGEQSCSSLKIILLFIYYLLSSE